MASEIDAGLTAEAARAESRSIDFAAEDTLGDIFIGPIYPQRSHKYDEFQYA